MVAKQMNDKGISILNSQFNYEGRHIDVITEDMARDVLNFTIEKKPCHTEDGIVIPRMNYLRRSDGGIVDANCSVGEEFEVTAQPLELLDIAKFIMSNVPSVRIETVASMYNGGTCFITLSVGDKWLVKGDNSPHWINVVINNPLTRSKFHLVKSIIRVVCENTLNNSCKKNNSEGFHFSHTTNARAMMTQALEGMKKELDEAKTMRQMCEFLASRSISTEQVNRILDILYPLPTIKPNENTRSLSLMQGKRDDVLNQFESDTSFTDKTFYSFLSANTYTIQHPIHKQNRTDDTQIAFENITGNRADFKSRILTTTLAVAMGDNNTPMIGANGGSDVIDAEFTMVA